MADTCGDSADFRDAVFLNNNSCVYTILVYFRYNLETQIKQYWFNNDSHIVSEKTLILRSMEPLIIDSCGNNYWRFHYCCYDSDVYWFQTSSSNWIMKGVVVLHEVTGDSNDCTREQVKGSSFVSFVVRALSHFKFSNMLW